MRKRMEKNDYTLNFVLKNLIDNFITLKGEDRKIYEKKFRYVTDCMIEELCKDENFASLYKGRCLTGMYFVIFYFVLADKACLEIIILEFLTNFRTQYVSDLIIYSYFF